MQLLSWPYVTYKQFFINGICCSQIWLDFFPLFRLFFVSDSGSFTEVSRSVWHWLADAITNSSANAFASYTDDSSTYAGDDNDTTDGNTSCASADPDADSDIANVVIVGVVVVVIVGVVVVIFGVVIVVLSSW